MKIKNKQKLNLITLIILGFGLHNSNVFASSDLENRVNDLNGKLNKIINENLTKEWREEGNLLKYDSYVWLDFNERKRGNNHIKIRKYCLRFLTFYFL